MIILKYHTDVWKEVLAAQQKGESVTVARLNTKFRKNESRLLDEYSGPSGVITWTSGSTGEAKGVVIPWEVVNVRTAIVSKAIGIDNLAVSLNILPLFQSFGLLTGCLMVHDVGGRVLTPPKHNLQHTSHLIKDNKVTCLFTTPQFLEALESEQLLRKYPSLKCIITGGSFFSEEKRQRVVELTGVPVYTSYGATELGFITLTKGSVADGCVGEPLIPVRIRNGYVEVSGPTLAHGYIHGPLPLTDDGWYQTGDRGFMKNGLLYLEPRGLEKGAGDMR